MDAPPRILNPNPLQSHPSMDITLSLSPITHLDFRFETTSPSLSPPHQPPLMGNDVMMSADVARGHGGDGGCDDRPPTNHIPTGCEGCFANRGKGTRKSNLGGRKVGRLHTRQETRNLGLKKITDDKGPVPIRFERDDKIP
ncbi:hypothetical protein Tco_0017521 [Tanacetum coccineum]